MIVVIPQITRCICGHNGTRTYVLHVVGYVVHHLFAVQTELLNISRNINMNIILHQCPLECCCWCSLELHQLYLLILSIHFCISALFHLFLFISLLYSSLPDKKKISKINFALLIIALLFFRLYVCSPSLQNIMSYIVYFRFYDYILE
jgi:hypothetical protein